MRSLVSVGPSGLRVADAALNAPVVALLATACIGAIAWGEHLAMLALAPAGVALWASRRTRLDAWLVMLVYFLAAARGLPFGAAQYYGAGTPAMFSIVLWVGASLIASMPWCLAWGRSGFYWRAPLAIALCIVPPVGVVGWANPILTAGVFFPSMGWAGLVAMTMVLVLICYWPWRTAGMLVPVALTASLIHWPVAPTWIATEQTRYGGSGAEGRDLVRDYFANQDMIERARRATRRVVIFPENTAGMWTFATSDLWKDLDAAFAAQGRVVMVGAEVPVLGSARTRNALVLNGAQHGEMVQRIPVPVSMWQPWSQAGTQAHLWSDGIGLLDGHRVAVFICYEQLLVWPMLLSQRASPTVLIGVSNTYWAAQTSIPAIQATSLGAWSRLFDVPFVLAVNR